MAPYNLSTSTVDRYIKVSSSTNIFRAGERIRTSEACAADYKSAPFDLFGTPAFINSNFVVDRLGFEPR